MTHEDDNLNGKKKLGNLEFNNRNNNNNNNNNNFHADINNDMIVEQNENTLNLDELNALHQGVNKVVAPITNGVEQKSTPQNGSSRVMLKVWNSTAQSSEQQQSPIFYQSPLKISVGLLGNGKKHIPTLPANEEKIVQEEMEVQLVNNGQLEEKAPAQTVQQTPVPVVIHNGAVETNPIATVAQQVAPQQVDMRTWHFDNTLKDNYKALKNIPVKTICCLDNETLTTMQWQGESLNLENSNWYFVDTLKDETDTALDEQLLRDCGFPVESVALLTAAQLKYLKK